MPRKTQLEPVANSSGTDASYLDQVANISRSFSEDHHDAAQQQEDQVHDEAPKEDQLAELESDNSQHGEEGAGKEHGPSTQPGETVARTGEEGAVEEQAVAEGENHEAGRAPSSKKLQCTNCGKSNLSSLGGLKNHMRACLSKVQAGVPFSQPKMFNCPTCPKTYTSQKRLENHVCPSNTVFSQPVTVQEKTVTSKRAGKSKNATKTTAEGPEKTKAKPDTRKEEEKKIEEKGKGKKGKVPRSQAEARQEEKGEKQKGKTGNKQVASGKEQRAVKQQTEAKKEEGKKNEDEKTRQGRNQAKKTAEDRKKRRGSLEKYKGKSRK